jgi:hypothetical protein
MSGHSVGTDWGFISDARMKPLQVSGWMITVCSLGFDISAVKYGHERYHYHDLLSAVCAAQRSPRTPEEV